MGDVQYIVTLPQSSQASAIQLPSNSLFIFVLIIYFVKLDGQVIQLSPTIQSPLVTIGVNVFIKNKNNFFYIKLDFIEFWATICNSFSIKSDSNTASIHSNSCTTDV